jgi:p-hydroxybenzoate 3-monooxygenase
MTERRTQVGIVGAGPAGLTLSHLLQQQGIESVVLEARSREHVERRIRAGLLDQGTVDVLDSLGVGARLQREGLVQDGFEIQFEGARHRIAVGELTGGRRNVIYGQTEIVKDLIRERLETDRPLLFEVGDVALHEIDGDRPSIRYTHDGAPHELQCDFIAGCDGFHGVCRPAIPDGVLRQFARAYPFAWLGIIAEVAPSNRELIYSAHERGFALLSMRSLQRSRLYLQCMPGESLDGWSDDRIWAELHLRFGLDGWTLDEGPILEKSVTAMRSFVVEPMQYGRLFLAGDAAHVVPPSAAKGLNLAIADVVVLAAALAEWYTTRSAERLRAYSETCLRRVWRGQHFSSVMTDVFHKRADGDEFDQELQRAQLRYLLTSHAAATSFAENYAGLAIL